MRKTFIRIFDHVMFAWFGYLSISDPNVSVIVPFVAGIMFLHLYDEWLDEIFQTKRENSDA